MSKFIKGCFLFVISMAIIYGIFAVGMAFFNQYYVAILMACGLVYFALLYVLESIALALFKISLKEYLLSTMIGPMLFGGIGLVIVKIVSSLGGFSAGSFADLAWYIVLTVVLVVSAIALAIRGMLLFLQRRRKNA